MYLYSKLPNLTLGFHGCDMSVYENVIKNGCHLKKSSNTYDWLGNGIYFWENNYQRALEWANLSPKIKTPAVIGSIIDLGNCLNLTDYASVEFLKKGYEILKLRCEASNINLPENHAFRDNDVLLRDLDCAVIQQIHDFNKETNRLEFDSVRGVFIEGAPAYSGSGFNEKTHIQLCVVNPNCIKGYFSPLTVNKEYSIP